MPDRLYFTDSDEANALIATDPMALLIGFALDQQVTVQKAFMGPLVLRERVDESDRGAADLPHREKYLHLVYGFLRGLLDLHEELVDDVEREL